MTAATRPFSGTLWMPLSTGAQALSDLALPVGVLQLVVFGPMFISEVPDWVPKWVSSVIVITLGLVWAAWFFVIVGALMGAWKARASDMILSPSGIRVVRTGRSRRLRGPPQGPPALHRRRRPSTARGSSAQQGWQEQPVRTGY
jgi:hypothetical protein